MSEIVEIVKLGHGGDGVTADGLFVPYTVPGDVARIRREAARGQLTDLVTSGPWRGLPRCGHFTRCGGCALQHVAAEPYLAWKRELVIAALKQRGFADAPVEAIRAVDPGTRRRASFKARATANGVMLGFYEPGSRNLVDLEECPVLVPRLANLMAPLKTHLRALLKLGETGELFCTTTDAGVDVSLKLKRARSPGLLSELAEFASALKLARLSWNGEPVVMAREPTLCVGRFTVALPPDCFLQPTEEGERILQVLVREHIGSARRVADLFSGCGTFALTLADGHMVHAADSVAPQIGALQAAAKEERVPVTAETRDLFRRPLSTAELASFDAVVLDPPRPGASAQVQALAQSKAPRVLYVSCNPASFARDARVLADGGFNLTRVVPLDQFLWSPHVELFAVFNKR